MEDSKPPPPTEDAVLNGSIVATLPIAAARVDVMVEGVDPKLTVMGGGEKEKAADYANCEKQVWPALRQTNQPRRVLYLPVMKDSL